MAHRSPRAGLARWRVPLGFLVAIVVVFLIEPTRRSLLAGLPIALLGQILRIWAAGHLEKSREVTQSGPYRLTRHPLYVGSILMGTGFAVASGSWVVVAVIAIYLAATIVIAIRAEETYLRATFGEAYDRYARGAAPAVHRRFSLERALRNKEYRSVIGFLLVAAVFVAAALTFRP